MLRGGVVQPPSMCVSWPMIHQLVLVLILVAKFKWWHQDSQDCTLQLPKEAKVFYLGGVSCPESTTSLPVRTGWPAQSGTRTRTDMRPCSRLCHLIVSLHKIVVFCSWQNLNWVWMKILIPFQTRKRHKLLIWFGGWSLRREVELLQGTCSTEGWMVGSLLHLHCHWGSRLTENLACQNYFAVCTKSNAGFCDW